LSKLLIRLVLVFSLFLATFGELHPVHGQMSPGPDGDVVVNSETQDGNTRQITASEGALPNLSKPDQPQISFIDSPTASCVQPDTTKNECFINWYYMSVSADPNYIITMTVALNDFGFVARYNGFFQTSMYAPYNMNPSGYKVVCGAPGASGDLNWGKAYPYTIRARDSSGLGSANYGTVYCPPFTP